MKYCYGVLFSIKHEDDKYKENVSVVIGSLRFAGIHASTSKYYQLSFKAIHSLRAVVLGKQKGTITLRLTFELQYIASYAMKMDLGNGKKPCL